MHSLDSSSPADCCCLSLSCLSLLVLSPQLLTLRGAMSSAKKKSKAAAAAASDDKQAVRHRAEAVGCILTRLPSLTSNLKCAAGLRCFRASLQPRQHRRRVKPPSMRRMLPQLQH